MLLAKAASGHPVDAMTIVRGPITKRGGASGMRSMSRSMVMIESGRRAALVRAGEMVLAHPMGFLVQFAGLVPSSRKWSLNRLAASMLGWAPNSSMSNQSPSA